MLYIKIPGPPLCNRLTKKFGPDNMHLKCISLVTPDFISSVAPDCISSVAPDCISYSRTLLGLHLQIGVRCRKR